MEFLSKNKFLIIGMCFLFGLALLLGGNPTVTLAEPPEPEADELEVESDEPGSEGTLFEDANPGTPASWDYDADDQVYDDGLYQRAATAAPGDCLGNPNRNVRYTSDGVIHVEGCGQTFTLTDVAASSRVTTDMLELVDEENKIWLLKVKMKVKEGATLNVIGGSSGDANWLRLRSDDNSGVWLKAINGNLRFEDTKVTSWNPDLNDYDRDYETEGRSYVAARSQWTDGRQTAPPTACDVNGGTQEPYEARLDIIDSDMSYLGYYAAEAYGVAWKVYAKATNPPPGRELYEMVDIFGSVHNSTFTNNYFGTYTFGAYCVDWIDNIFENNIEYGLDPHDDSDYLVIEDNIFRHNGNHGLICSKYCNNLTIRNNISHNNRNGIMLHRFTDDSLVENNHSYDNRDSGIAIFDSHRNTVINNRFENNERSAIRFSVGASDNLIANNILEGLAEDETGNGYLIFGYQGSDLPIEGDGRPKRNIIRDNQMKGYKSPMIKWKEATENRLERNTLSGISSTSSLTAYEFRPGYGNVVDTPFFDQDDDISTYVRTAVRTDELSLPSAWTYLRDIQLNKEIKIKLHSFSDSRMILEDTRNLIWYSRDTELTSSVDPSLSTSELTYDLVGGTEPIRILDFAVVPDTGTVEVTPLTWNTSSSFRKEWEEESSNSNSVTHTVGDLKINTCYRVLVNGNEINKLIANGNGQINFIYNGGYQGTVHFEVKETSGCSILNNGGTLSNLIYLPMLSQ